MKIINAIDTFGSSIQFYTIDLWNPFCVTLLLSLQLPQYKYLKIFNRVTMYNTNGQPIKKIRLIILCMKLIQEFGNELEWIQIKIPQIWNEII